MSRDVIAITKDPYLFEDRYLMRLSVPWPDLETIKSPEELHGYIISKVEALLAKGPDCDK